MNPVVHPYLNYGGNCREAFTFYADHLGGKVLAMMAHSQAPPGTPNMGAAPESIMYAQLQIGDSHIMGSDAPAYQPMRSAYLMYGVHSNEEAERAYKLLTEGGVVFMEMQETFFAHRFAMLRDRFGTSWMIIHGKQPPAA